MKHRWIAKACGFALLLTSVNAWTQDDAARAHDLFTQGSELFKKGEYREAAKAFEEANQLAPHGKALFSAGLAWSEAGVWAQAADALTAARASGQLGAAESEQSKAELVQLLTKVGRLSIVGPPDTTFSIAGRTNSTAPANLHLEPGIHLLRAEFEDGSKRTYEISVTPGSDQSFELEPLPETEAPAIAAPPPSDAPDFWTLGRGIGAVAIGSAAVSAASAGFFWSQANAARDDYFDSNFTDAEARSSATTNVTLTNVGWISAVVLAGVGVTLVFVSSPDDPAAQTNVGLSIKPGWSGVDGTF